MHGGSLYADANLKVHVVSEPTAVPLNEILSIECRLSYKTTENERVLQIRNNVNGMPLPLIISMQYKEREKTCRSWQLRVDET